ncbi:HAMP domain-containing sensor histidine kinase [Sphingomonas sp. gentR]|jgi:signal transduction histidine kinase|uniref:sensor histidine kinase n=1 Tax=unclassified Sphingomonas TaxID=196159 RepID=UPI00097288E0|nr:HAMP domain-containing sensor histidine kinase [Sphingomonas sp. LK11]APX65164.1 histidine kinase [Sphingomonas sp. LK11]
MVSRSERHAIAISLSLALAGATAAGAWFYGLWLALAGALLAILWLILLSVVATRRPAATRPAPTATEDRETALQRMVFDVSPTPLLLVDGTVARALNRAARRLFETDDRVLPAPPALLDRDTSHLRHAGRRWRADRVDIGRQAVVALIDVDSEEQTAEARASAEMIQVLGHEMLNGLVPIVSLAECGIAAADPQTGDPALLPEILTTLARQAEGLQRFTEAYRSLARLPPPLRQPVALAKLVDDLERLFSSRWPTARLTVDMPHPLHAALDRDQLNQAIWALLQNGVEAAGPHGHLGLSLRVQDGAILIDVSDDGPGIAPEQAHAIFRPFATTKTAGSGIGLSLARQIARGHGGTLNLSTLSPTSFRLRIPGGTG